ncbi:glycosyltransferase family 2 protein [Croceibacterium sp. TMG7-5b_MA50]|uniref:glycosyltransferase family 2 protein n=1 Tax=Croceibacterium sp. TMG7-5b_MA50 TaxID=3121290 RepID=UPI003221D0FE
MHADTARLPPTAPPLRQGAALAVVIPTFNERDNVARMVEVLDAALAGIPFEMVFVDDDSRDGTRDKLAEIAAADPRVRMVHRIGRRGLSTAVVEGILSTTTPYVAVIDADLQHDERVLPQMLEILQAGEADVVVGSRYTAGGSTGDWEQSRVRVSAVATKLARMVARVPLTDPMSGFFALTRAAFDSAVRDLSGQGYKVLLDICASSAAPLRMAEVPYQFRRREAGDSKLDAMIVWEYLLLLVDKLIGHVVPARFVSFMAIGGIGVFVHMAVLSLLMATGGLPFMWAQASATGVAMVFNFFVNNLLTYRDRRLKGFVAVTRGLLSFVTVCSVGAIANVGIAEVLFAGYRYAWWLAGLAGIVVGAFWNYAATALFTWKAK